jgi:hypothetical protein
MLPWQAIEGIDLDHLPRWRINRLVLLVPDRAQPLIQSVIAGAMRPFMTRMFGIRRHRVSCLLIKTSDDPYVVFQLALALWFNATGRSHPWSIEFSDQQNAELRTLYEEIRRQDQKARSAPTTTLTIEEILEETIRSQRFLIELGKAIRARNQVRASV